MIIVGVFLFFVSSLYAETLKELYEQGMKSYQEKNYSQAIEYLEKAIKMNPNFAQGYNALGLAYKELNANLQEAAWYFKAAIDINPNYVEAYDNLGKAYCGLGQFDKAEEYCKKALSLNPKDSSAQFSLGWIYLLGKSRPKDAISYFNKVIERSSLPNAYFGLGLAYFMTDNRAMVLEMITTLRGLNQNKLAEQLENMVRDYNYVSNEKGGSLVKIEPPPEEKKKSPVQGKIPVETPPTSKGLGGQTTRVKMRGKMFNVSDQGQNKNPSPPSQEPPY